MEENENQKGITKSFQVLECYSCRTYPTGPQMEGLLLRFRLEETGTVGGTGTEAGTVGWAEDVDITGTGGILNGEELLIGV